MALYHLPAFGSSGVLCNIAWVTKCNDDDSNKIYSFTNFLLKARTHLLCWKGLSAGTGQVAFASHSPLWRDTSVCINTWDTTDATYRVLTSSGMQGPRWTRITVRCMSLELVEDCKMFQFFLNFLERTVDFKCQCDCHISVDLGVTALSYRDYFWSKRNTADSHFEWQSDFSVMFSVLKEYSQPQVRVFLFLLKTKWRGRCVKNECNLRFVAAGV